LNTRNENLLVTGGTGFLGQKLVKRLKNLGYNVTALGRNEVAGKKLETLGITFIKADLKDTGSIKELCMNQDYVFHCGALSSPWGRYKDFYNANVLGTQNIISGCREHNVKRLIYVSTTSIYNDFTDKFNLSENEPLPSKFANTYAETKYMAEQELDKAYLQGVPVITIRPSGIFGPNDTSILPRLIRANNSKFIPVVGNKKVYVDITYVENVIDALLLCKDSPDHTLGKKYNITNDSPISLYEFLEDVIVRLGYKFKPRKISFNTAYQLASIMEFVSRTVLFYKEPPLTRYSVGVLTKSRTLDICAAKNDLGYYPKITVEEGVIELLKWWKEANAG